MSSLKTYWKHYGLSITLAGLFLISWIGQGFFQWAEFAQEQTIHGQAADIAGFITVFLSRTLENWQSEFLQLLTFVVLTSFLIHKGSHESKDSQDRLEAKVDELLARKETS